MTDERLRDLARRAEEGDQARLALHRERVRSGQLPSEQLRPIELLQPGVGAADLLPWALGTGDPVRERPGAEPGG
jgi:hypothetical protein